MIKLMAIHNVAGGCLLVFILETLSTHIKIMEFILINYLQEVVLVFPYTQITGRILIKPMKQLFLILEFTGTKTGDCISAIQAF